MRQFFSIFAPCTAYGLPQPAFRHGSSLKRTVKANTNIWQGEICVKIIGSKVCVSLYLTVWERYTGRRYLVFMLV